MPTQISTTFQKLSGRFNYYSPPPWICSKEESSIKPESAHVYEFWFLINWPDSYLAHRWLWRTPATHWSWSHRVWPNWFSLNWPRISGQAYHGPWRCPACTSPNSCNRLTWHYTETRSCQLTCFQIAAQPLFTSILNFWFCNNCYSCHTVSFPLWRASCISYTMVGLNPHAFSSLCFNSVLDWIRSFRHLPCHLDRLRHLGHLSLLIARSARLPPRSLGSFNIFVSSRSRMMLIGPCPYSSWFEASLSSSFRCST